MAILNEIISILEDARSIAILPHVSADGDALGSSIALGLALGRLNKDVAIFTEEDIPCSFSYLPGKELVRTFSEGIFESIEATDDHSRAQGSYDVVVALDTGDMGRLGKRIGIFDNAGITVNIDHHQTNTGFASHNYVHTLSSAVGEIIYQMIKMMGLDLEPLAATCLYIAIATDTGGFRYSNTTPVTHQIAADLINNGVDVAELSQKIFESAPLSKVKLMGQAINALELMEGGKIAFIVVTDEMLTNAGAKEEDTEGLVNMGRSIDGVEVAVLLRQRGDGLTKANLRSKAYVDVSAIARIFNGGGHKRASGFTTDSKLDDIKVKLLDEIRKELM